MDTRKAYETLNLKYGTAFDEIKTAYRKLALDLHPDKKKSDNNGKKFQEINTAYNVLKNEFAKNIIFTDNRKKTNPHQKHDFTKTQQRSQDQNIPEQDWSKYTRQFDENTDFWKKYEKNFWKEYDKTINTDEQNNKYTKSKEPPNLFVDVDPSLCIACQSCETLAPSVFHIDRNSNINPKSKVIDMNGAKFDKIIDAAKTCPTKAIIVENNDTKKRLYPL